PVVTARDRIHMTKRLRLLRRSVTSYLVRPQRRADRLCKLSQESSCSPKPTPNPRHPRTRPATPAGSLGDGVSASHFSWSPSSPFPPPPPPSSEPTTAMPRLLKRSRPPRNP